MWGVQPYEDAMAISTPVRIESSARTDSLAGGHRRGHLCALVIWNRGHEPVSRSLYCAVVANFYLLGLWLILGDRPPHHHDLCVAHRGDHGQALLTLLCVPRGPALQPTLATLGRRHPSGSPIGAGGRGHAGHL